MKYEKGKKITDVCQFKKGKKYISECGVVFEFSHIGEMGTKYFKDEGQGYGITESEYNCIGFIWTNFYEAIEVAPELPNEGLVVHKELGSIIYRTGWNLGYGFENGNYYIRNTWTFGTTPKAWRPATAEEKSKFIKLLKEECERRGLFIDTKIKECLFPENSNKINTGYYVPCENLESVWNRNGCIFHKGKFAEPLEEEEEILEEKIKELIELGKSKGLKINVTFKQ